jgi:hypothetical protein
MSERLLLRWGLLAALTGVLGTAILAAFGARHLMLQRDVALINTLSAAWALQIEHVGRLPRTETQPVPDLQACNASPQAFLSEQPRRAEAALVYVHSSGIACVRDGLVVLTATDIDHAARVLTLPNDPPPSLAINAEGRLALYSFARANARAPDPGIWMVMTISQMEPTLAAMTRALGARVYLIDHHGQRMAGDHGALWDRVQPTLVHGQASVGRQSIDGRAYEVVAVPVTLEGPMHYGHVVMLRDISTARGQTDARVWWLLLTALVGLAVVGAVIVGVERRGRPLAMLMRSLRQTALTIEGKEVASRLVDPEFFPPRSEYHAIAKAIVTIERDREEKQRQHDNSEKPERGNH